MRKSLIPAALKKRVALFAALIFFSFVLVAVGSFDAKASGGSIFGDDMVVAALKLSGFKKKTAAPPAETAPPPSVEEAPAPSEPTKMVEEAAEDEPSAAEAVEEATTEEPADEVVEEAPPEAPPAEVAEEAPAMEPAAEVVEEVAPAALAPAPVPVEDEVEDIEEEDLPMPVAGGELLIESKPSGIKVFVDGEELGVTPLAVEGLADTSHEVILYHPEKGAFSQVSESGVGKIYVDLTEEGGLGVGVLKIESAPDNVRVDIDGKRAGLTPLTQPVVAGLHKILLSKDGFVEKEISVEISAGETATVSEKLEERAGSMLVIVQPSGAEVILDGHSLGIAQGPLKIADVPPGIHELSAVKDGYVAWSRNNVKVQRERTETVLISLQPQTSEANVRIYTDPEGARVWLDGKEIGVAGPDGVGFNTEKGTHILRMEVNPAVTPGYRPLQVSISFNEDVVNYKEQPIKLPIIDEAFINATRLYERGENEEALAFLDRVDPGRISYPESRIMVVDILKELRRTTEIPAEFEKLFAQPIYRKNPVLNLAMGYWTIQAARQAGNAEAVDLLIKGLEALDRCVESMDYFPADERQVLALKAHYYSGIASELLFGLSAEKKHVKKGVQAWEMFFARLNTSEETLGSDWVNKAKKHQKNLVYLEKKLGR
ncbi:MAG: hypothetical protein C0608_06850 [Deltaproteobacteria bacterium]|nr:MAG: hypothetical protein C0608_06850 [Deltaproteobacteria bacterium]